MRIFSVKSIKFKIFISNLAIVVVMFLLFGIFLIKFNSSQARKTALLSAKSSLSQASVYLAEKTVSIRNAVDSIALSQQTLDVLNMDNKNKYADIVKWNIDYHYILELVMKSINNSDIDRIIIATENELAKIINTPLIFNLSSLIDTAWYNEWLDTSESYFWHMPYNIGNENGDNEGFICFTRSLLYSYYNYETIYIGYVGREVFDNLLNINTLDEYTSFFIMNSKREILSGTKNLRSEYMEHITEKILARNYNYLDSIYLQTESMDGHEYIIGITGIPNTNLYLTYIYSISDMIADMVNTNSKNIVVIMLIIFPMVLFLSLAVAFSVTKRLDRLKKNMVYASEGDFDIDIMQPAQDDEIGVLTKQFNYMLTKISILMDSQYSLGKRIKELELKSLQAQINPHFLYNTLDLIKWRAIDNKDGEAVELVSALSNYYKRSLGKGQDIVTLEDEIDHVKSYVYIQNKRFDNGIRLSADIPLNLRNCLLPKITLQPIVENAIVHGLLEKEEPGGNIDIRAEYKGNNTYIYVTDNGVGMDQGKADALLSAGPDMSITGSGYGLKNIDERIKLTFGKLYGISFISSVGEGTTVIINIPLNNKSIQGDNFSTAG